VGLGKTPLALWQLQHRYGCNLVNKLKSITNAGLKLMILFNLGANDETITVI
jgi:hypothetical protein